VFAAVLSLIKLLFMRPITTVLFFIITLAVSTGPVNAQCKVFAERICKVELGSYVHDGNYHAAILSEGQEAELYKTFHGGQDYRLAICGDDNLPDIEFRVMDTDRNLLYTNRDDDYNITWDISVESTEQLLISVKVPAGEGNSQGGPESGCVAIMFGFREEE